MTPPAPTATPLPAEPLVSIVTVFHQREAVVAESVASLLAQTYPRLEVVLVDDGSSDGTAAALERFADDPRVRVRSHANVGFTPAMRAAVASAEGDVIAVHGSGDVSLPERIERQVALLTGEPDVVATGCWFTNVDPDTGRVVDVRRPRLDEPDQIAQLLRGCPYSHGEVSFRRDAYDAVGGYREPFRYSQDYDLWLRLAGVGRLAVVPEDLYVRYHRGDGVSRSSERTLVQRMLADFARQCTEQRVRTGRDAIDRHGPAGLLLWDPSPRMRREIAVHGRRLLLNDGAAGDAEAWLRLVAGRGPVSSRPLLALARLHDRSPRAYAAAAGGLRAVRGATRLGRRVVARRSVEEAPPRVVT